MGLQKPARGGGAGAPGKPLDNPFLNARREWNDHVGRVVAARSLWQAVALFSLLIALAAVAGLIQLASRTRFIPYVVEVDKAGNVAAVARADTMPPATRVVIETQLKKFVTLARRVTTDTVLQRQSIWGAYSVLREGDPATQKLSDHYRDHEPKARAADETAETEIESVLPVSDETWQVDWVETVWRRNGELKERFPMRALLQVFQSNPEATTEEALTVNALGVYVKDFSWARRAPEEVRE